MSARKTKRDRRWQKDARIARHVIAQGLRKDTRVANAEYVPVRNHKVRNLSVRVKDAVLGLGGPETLWPVRRWDPASGQQHLIFIQGFRHWPSGTFDADAIEVRIRDWREAPLYSTVRIDHAR